MKCKLFVLLILNVSILLVAMHANFTVTASIVSAYFPTDEWQTISSEEPGFGKKHEISTQMSFPTIPELDSEILGIMEESGINSVASAIIKNNSLVWANGYGDQTSLNTIYGIASITKTFTAVSLLQLYEEGLFDLDDDVNTYLPFSLRNPKYPDDSITFRMLLTHKSSLTRETWNLTAFIHQDLANKFNLSVNFPILPTFLKELVIPNGTYNFGDVFSTAKPGTLYDYSNIGYCILGYLLEILSNKSLDTYFSEHIFQPLQMSSTGFDHTLFGSALAIPYDVPVESLSNGSVDSYVQYPYYSCIPVGSTGLLSSVLDLSKYLIVHMNGGEVNNVRILKEETINLMHSSEFGWDGSIDGGGHDGSEIGYLSRMKYKASTESDPSIGAIVFVNRGSFPIITYKDLICSKLMATALDYKFGQEKSTSGFLGIFTLINIGLIVIILRVSKK